MITYYWRGGSAIWNGINTGQWGIISGGPGGFGPPTSGDDVVLNVDSHTTDYTVTLASGAVCRDVSFSAPLTGNVTLAGVDASSVFGSFALYATLIRTYTGTLNFKATSLGKTITCAGVTLGSQIIFDGAGGGWTNVDAMNIGNEFIVTTNGTWSTGNQTISCGRLQISTVGTMSVSFGSSVVNVTGTSTSFILLLGGAGLTFNAGTSTINLLLTSASKIFQLQKSATFYNLSITSNTYAILQTFATISISPTVSNNLTIAGGNDSTQRIYVGPDGNTSGTPIGITCNGTVSLSNVDFEDVTASGSAGGWLTGTSIGDCGGNSNITFTSPVTATWGNDTGSLPDPTKWDTGKMPLPQDATVFGAGSFTGSGKTVTNSIAGLRVGAMNWANSTNAPTFVTTNAINCFGSYTLNSGVILSGVGAFKFRGRGAFTLTAATKTLNNITVDVFGGSLTLQDALIVTNAITQTRGSFIPNGQAVTANNYTCTSGFVCVLTLGSTLWVLTGTGNVWNVNNASLTISANTATIKTTDASASSKTFIGGGKTTYYNLWFSNPGSGICIITGANTFNQLRLNDGVVAHTLQFTAATATTVTDWQVNGAPGALVSISSVTAATHTLVKAGGGLAVSDYLSVTNSIANPSGDPFVWYAGDHGVNGGGTTRWNFRSLVAYIEGLSEGIAVSESVDALMHASEGIAEGQAIGESMSSQQAAVDALSEPQAISESLDSFAQVLEALQESQVISEDLLSRFAGVENLEEGMDIFELLEELYRQFGPLLAPLVLREQNDPVIFREESFVLLQEVADPIVLKPLEYAERHEVEMSKFVIIRASSGPPLKIKLEHYDGSPVDLTNATSAKLYVGTRIETPVSQLTLNKDLDVVSPKTLGELTRNIWAAADTILILQKNFIAQVEVTFSDKDPGKWGNFEFIVMGSLKA